ncbi:MAG: flippase [Clostridia bacterium]|nr:flippase [Clostridia bacterium]
MSIAKKVFKNSSANLISFVWNSLLFFLLTPFMVNQLGAASYGIIALTATLTGFLGFLDLGFTGAAVKQISESYAKRDIARVRNVVNLSLIIYTIMGVIASLLLILFINSGYLYYFKIDAGLMTDLKFSLYIASANIILNMVLSVFSNIPYALQMNVVQAKCNIMLSTFTNFGIALCLILGYGLKAVMLIKLASSIAAIIVYYVTDRKLIPELSVKFYFNRVLFREMFSFSVYNMITQLSQAFFGQFDRLILGSMVNVSSVTYYVVPAGAAVKFNNVITNITNVIFPLTSELSATSNTDKIRRLYCKSLKYISLISFCITIPVFLYSENLLTLWMGKDFSLESANVFRILLVSNLLLSGNAICYYMFNGLNMPKINTIYVIITSVMRVVLSVAFIPIYGVSGAAIAFLASMIPVPFFICYFERVLNIKTLYFLFRVYLPLAVSSAVVIFGFSIIDYSGVNILVLAFLGALSVLAFLAVCFVFRYFDSEDINRLRQFGKKVNITFNKVLKRNLH